MTTFDNALRSRNGAFNFRPSNLPKWRAAIARVRAGAGRGRLLICGDSTSMGAGAGSSGTTNLTGAMVKSWPSQLTKLLATTVPTSFNSLWTDQACPIAYPGYDPRVALGANWAASTTAALFQYSAGAVNNLAFTPQGAIDSIIVYMVQNGGTGTASFDVDGGASLGTLTSAGGSAITPVSATVTRGAHTINIVPANNAGFFLSGIVAWDSTVPAIDVIQDGQYGSQAMNWNDITSPWNFGAHAASLSPDLTIVCLTINDSNANVAVATWQAQMQTIISNVKATGSDVILMTGPPSNTTQATGGLLDSYIAAMQALALGNNAPLFDLKSRWISYAVTNASMPYFDAMHPGAVGYQDEAAAVFELIGQV